MKITEELSNRHSVVNTSSFNKADLNMYINSSEIIDKSICLRKAQRQSIPLTLQATKTREQIHECSTLDDDQFLTALEHQNSYIGPNAATFSISESFNNLMEYFDEDVSLERNPPTPTKKAIVGKVASVVANFRSRTAQIAHTQISTILNKRQSEMRSSIKELKKRYESDNMCVEKIKKNVTQQKLAKSPEMSRKSKVKQMAQMFNTKMTQILKNGGKETAYTTEQKKHSPSIKTSPVFTKKSTPQFPVPKPRTKFPIKCMNKISSPKSRRRRSTNTTCLVAEDVFNQLSVKDKALLFNKFIEDISESNLQFNKHEERTAGTSGIKEEFKYTAIENVNTGSVKRLAEKLEAKCFFLERFDKPLVFHRSVDSYCTTDMYNATLPLKRTPALPIDKKLKAKEAEDVLMNTSLKSLLPRAEEVDLLHISTLTVVLKPSVEVRKRSLLSMPLTKPRIKRNVNLTTTLNDIESNQKRSSNSSYSDYQVYAPPKKIRHTRLERVFFNWLKEKNGVSFEIKPLNDSTETIKIASDQEVSTDSLNGDEQKPLVDKSLEDSLEKLENLIHFTRNESDEAKEKLNMGSMLPSHAKLKRICVQPANENMEVEKIVAKLAATEIKESTEVISQTLPINPRKQNSAPPPTSAVDKVTSSSDCLSTSTFEQSEAEESESGLSSMPKVTSDESQPEHTAENILNEYDDFELTKPLKPQRKKKLSRTLTWKKENSIVESKPVLTTDSDSDYKWAEECKNTSTPLQLKQKKNNLNNGKLILKNDVNPLMENSIVELDRKIRLMNSPRKIKSAYTLAIMPSPSSCTASDSCESDMAYTYAVRETSRSCPSIIFAMDSQETQLRENVLPTEITANSELKQDSNIDQGFETDLNEINPFSLKNPEKTTHFSTSSLKNTNLNMNTKHKLISTSVKEVVPTEQNFCGLAPMSAKLSHCSFKENDSRRSSILMQFMQEHHPLDHTYKGDIPCIPDSFSGGSTASFLPNIYSNDLRSKSTFWITAGDLKVSYDICHRPAADLRRQFHHFTQKRCDLLDFGIDEYKFSLLDTVNGHLPKINKTKGHSQYWFSNGDLVMMFKGKLRSANEVLQLFTFLRQYYVNKTVIRFGVDDMEFSISQDYRSSKPELPEMLVGSQTGKSKELEGCTRDTLNSKIVQITDLDNSELESEEFENRDNSDMSPLPFDSGYYMNQQNSDESTFSPVMFSF